MQLTGLTCSSWNTALSYFEIKSKCVVETTISTQIIGWLNDQRVPQPNSFKDLTIFWLLFWLLIMYYWIIIFMKLNPCWNLFYSKSNWLQNRHSILRPIFFFSNWVSSVILKSSDKPNRCSPKKKEYKNNVSTSGQIVYNCILLVDM